MMKTSLRGIGLAAVASGALALSLAAPALASTQSSSGYQFRTLNDQRDVTFNQLLGIDNHGAIVGYFGSGAAGHANKGYRLYLPYGQGNYSNENFPGSVQTQVTGLNDLGVTVGFWSTQNTANMTNNNFGFYRVDGHYHTVNFPTGNNASPQVDQLLGVNDRDVAVGAYTTGSGSNAATHGFTWRPGYGFRTVDDPHGLGATTINGVNDAGDLVGFYTDSAGNTDGMLALP